MIGILSISNIVSAPGPFNNNGKRFSTAKEWFEDDLNVKSLGADDELNLQDSSWLDRNLHQLSRWSFSHQDWERFVSYHVHSNPMLHAVLSSKNSKVLEIGSGAGAFSRSLLRLYPTASVVGIDYSEKMVKISNRVLRGGNSSTTPRFFAHVASMEKQSDMTAALGDPNPKSNASFELAFMVGSLCYMPSHESVILALSNVIQHLKIGGFLTVSMLPETEKAMRSCETLVEKKFIRAIADQVGYEVVTFSNMSQWGIGNQVDRYATVLRKTKHTKSDKNLTSKQSKANQSQSCPEPTKLDGMSDIKYNRTITAIRILEFLSAKFEQKNAPIAINFGSALHEFREGKSCYAHRIGDKDVDITVLEAHFPLIHDLNEELRERFGWSVHSSSEMNSRLFATIKPLDDGRRNGLPDANSFNIDFYGFKCNAEENTVWFPWDQITTRINALLPLKKHGAPISKQLYDGVDYDWVASKSFVYIPSDPACLLENIYGPDFRTPMNTKYYVSYAVDKPICKSPDLDASERLEFLRQLMLCSGCKNALTINSDAFVNITLGLNVTDPFCTVDN